MTASMRSPRFPPGVYQLEVEKSGFTKQTPETRAACESKIDVRM